MPCTGAAGGVALAGRLQEALARRNWPFEPVTVSVGVATLHLAMGTVDDLIQAADDALYAAKREGRNRVVQAMDLQDASPIRPLPDPSR